MLIAYLKNNRFRSRSLPNYKTLGKYLTAYVFLFSILGVYNFVYITLIADDFSIVFPDLFIVAIPIMFVTIYHRIENEYKAINRHDMIKIVMFIQTKHSQALTEELNERPEALSLTYKKKGLLYWTKYYKNTEAHSIIAKKMGSLASNKK